MNRRLSPIEEARSRHPLADVASRTGIWLPTTTGRVTVRCPMPAHGHPDRTPSMRLFLDDGTWYCFGCSDRAGDVVQWAEQTEGVGWRQAIEILDSGKG
jgi:DNA primase